MSEALDQLLHTTKVKEFAKLFKEYQQQFDDPKDFLQQAAAYLPPRLYEHYYEDGAPHSLFGLAAAADSLPLFPESRRWWPLVQQAWFAAGERKRSPLDLGAFPVQNGGSGEARWRRFEDAVERRDFQQAVGLARGLLENEEDRELFRRCSLTHAMVDTAQGALKFLYLAQVWRLAEILEGQSLDKMLLAPLHFLVMGPRESELSEWVEEEWRRKPARRLLENQGALPEPLYSELEKVLLFGPGRSEAVGTIHTMADSGVGLEGVVEALSLAGVQSIANSKAGPWIWPMRAFLFSFLSGRFLDSVEAERRSYVLMLAAALLHRASARSRQGEANRRLNEMDETLYPRDALNTLRSVVSHSDPYASATAVHAILGMGESKKERLFQSLATLAAKNDGQMGSGYDLLLVRAAVDAYRRSESGHKDKFLLSCGFFLGRIKKSYALFGAYGV
ncbi:MAG: hypothetical protein ACE5JX_04200 [Acidobacteriota bacterium]